jgi:hypothetical protein
MKIIRIAQSPKLTVNRGYGLPVKVPMAYLRFGLPPVGNKPSRNWLEDKDEKGLSVYRAWFDPKVKKFILQSDDNEDPYGNLIGTFDSFVASDKKIYLVGGREMSSLGADNEVLLDPETVKVIKEVSRNDIVEESAPNKTLSDEYLDPIETPNYDNETNWEVEDGLKDFKMPTVEIKPRVIQRTERGPWRGEVPDNLWEISEQERQEILTKIIPLLETVDQTVYDIYLNGERHRPEVNNYSYEIAIRGVKSEIQYMISRHKREME